MGLSPLIFQINFIWLLYNLLFENANSLQSLKHRSKREGWIIKELKAAGDPSGKRNESRNYRAYTTIISTLFLSSSTIEASTPESVIMISISLAEWHL